MKKKIKNVPVSSRSFFGQPSQMDKEIEKWTNQGWTYAHSKPLNKNRLLLTFESIAEDEDKKPNAFGGCIVLLGIALGCYLAFNTVRSLSPNPTPTQPIAVTRQQIAAAPTRKPQSPTIPVSSSTPTPKPQFNTPTLKPASPIPTNTPSPTPVQVVVNSNQNVNLRQDPNTDASIVDVLEPQTALIVLRENEDGTWLNVQTDDNKTGWISTSLVADAKSENTTVSQPVDTKPETVCIPNFRQIGSFFRLANSFDGTNHSTYSYKVTGLSNSDDYLVTLTVGKDWEGEVFPMTIFDHYEGQLSIEEVNVDYLYEGELGFFEMIGFSFEYGDLKLSGDVMINADSASSRDRANLQEVLEYFVSQIVNC
jgi:uncharacterized protein YgiM (DUF1202 family)